MSKLLYAWEFTASLGHTSAFLPLARALRQRGRELHRAGAQKAAETPGAAEQ